jgi:hypothetical protein
MMGRRTGLCSLLALSACYDPDFGNGKIRCAATAPQCPSGYQCLDGVHCWKNGTDLSGVLPDDLGDLSASGDASESDAGDFGVEIDLALADLRPAVTVSLSQTTVDVLAFASPEPQTSVTASVANLNGGDDTGVTAVVASGDSASIVSVVNNVITVQPTSTYDVGVSTTPPPPTLVTVRSISHPETSTTLTVRVHAFVDESAQAGAAFTASDNMQLLSVDLQPSGAVMVGGIGYATNVPGAAARLPGGSWTPSYTSATNGAVSSIAAAADGSFLLAGVTGGALDAHANRQVLVSHCHGTPITCDSTNLAPAGELGNISPFSVVFTWNAPRIATKGTAKVLLYGSFLNNCSGGNVGTVKVLYSNTASLDDVFTTGQQIPFSDENPPGAHGDSCPFNTQTQGIPTGMALNTNGTQLWLGSNYGCGVASGGNGCTSQAAALGGSGLAAVPLTDPNLTWTSHWSEAISAGVIGPILKRGYDDSLLGISTYSPSKVQFIWYDASASPTPPPNSFVAPNTSVSDEGYTVGGAGRASSSWNTAGSDIFFFAARSNGVSITEYYMGWYAASVFRHYATWSGGSGTVIHDMAFIKNAAGDVEAYAVGAHTIDPTHVAPTVYHLK